MSRADYYFKYACTKILNEGFDDHGLQVRPKWADTGEPAYTKKIFSYITEYDLSKEFPALTLRKQAFKNCVRELLWMWQKKSNVVDDLGKAANIWRAWEQPDGTIGKTYSYQLAQVYDLPEGKMDQVDALLYNLKNNPMNRRMIVTMWNPKDLKEMPLAPCVYEIICDVQGDKLNMILIQRSADCLSAGAPGGWDEMQYAMLQCMLAQSTGLKPGIFTHVIANLHIYDRHEAIIKEIMNNPEYDSPKFILNPDKTDFYSFTEDDFKLEEYNATKLETKFDVAV